MSAVSQPRELEDECTRRLSRERVSLIGEVAWEEELVEALARSWWVIGRRRRVRWAAERFPVSLAVHLVTVANRRYQDGDLWGHFPHFQPADRSVVGRAFERALRLRALERFPQFVDEGAHRYVAPILSHGGIPRPLVARFLRRLLLPALRNFEASTAEELVGRWRTNEPAGMPRPVLRFLRYGGATAVDFVARCIELTHIDREELRRDPTLAGLPGHVVRAFLEVPETEVVRLSKPVRPTITLDPWDDRGPVVRLPPVGRDAAAGLVWIVDDGTAKEFPGSPYAERIVELAPAAYWTITAKREGEPLRTTRVEALGGTRIVCFDETGTYVSEERGLRAEHVWVIVPTHAELVAIADGREDGLTPVENAAVLRGPWSGYKVQRYSLAGVGLLGVRLDGSIIERIPVTRVTDRPALIGQPVHDVQSVDALPVYAEMPALSLPSGSWRVMVGGQGKTVSKEIRVSGSTEIVHLAEIWGAPTFGRFEVLARGSLGRDVATAFAVVPGLRVPTPDEVIPPSRVVELALSAAPPITLHPSTLTLDAGQDAGETWAWLRHKGKVGLIVRVPRLRWGVRYRDQEPSLGTRVLTLSPEELGTEAEALVIATGRAGRTAEVRLEGFEGIYQAERTRPADDRGTTVFPLDKFRDTARMVASAFELTVSVDAVTYAVAEYRPAPSVARRPSLPTLGTQVEARVTEVRTRSLCVAGDGWTGRIFESRLPRHTHEYRTGDRITAWVRRYTTDGVELDAKPFEPDRFRIGEEVEAVVDRVSAERAWVDVGGFRGYLRQEQAPLPLSAYRSGEHLQVRVIGRNRQERAFEVSARRIDPASFPIGSTVRGRVLRSSRTRVWVDLGKAVGVVRDRETEPGRTPESYRPNDELVGTVVRVDPVRGHVEISSRPWNPGVSQGDHVVGHVVRVNERNVLVRLPSGALGGLPFSRLPPHMASDPHRHLSQGKAIPVRVTWINPRQRKIGLAADFESYTFGDSDDDSPFAVLRG